MSLAVSLLGMELEDSVAETLRLYTPVDPGGKSQMEGWQLPGTIQFSMNSIPQTEVSVKGIR